MEDSNLSAPPGFYYATGLEDQCRYTDYYTQTIPSQLTPERDGGCVAGAVVSGMSDYAMPAPLRTMWLPMALPASGVQLTADQHSAFTHQAGDCDLLPTPQHPEFLRIQSRQLSLSKIRCCPAKRSGFISHVAAVTIRICPTDIPL